MLKTLLGHDNWVRALAFHPAGKYLLSVSDDKTIRCWDLTQDGRCVKTVEDAHAHFVSCLRWAPPAKESANGDGKTNGVGGKKEEKAVGVRCVIATGSVDMSVRVFAS